MPLLVPTVAQLDRLLDAPSRLTWPAPAGGVVSP
jgi:hypothetical protein